MANEAKSEPLRHRFRAMGTVCEVVLEAASAERARRFAALALIVPVPAIVVSLLLAPLRPESFVAPT